MNVKEYRYVQYLCKVDIYNNWYFIESIGLIYLQLATINKFFGIIYKFVKQLVECV